MTLIPSRGISRPDALRVKAKSRASCRLPANLITLRWLLSDSTKRVDQLVSRKAQRTWKRQEEIKK